MLTIRLPAPLEAQLSAYCAAAHLSKTAVVQQALEQHLSHAMPQLQPAEADPFLALIGSGNGKYSTEDVMRLSRGEDWNQP